MNPTVFAIADLARRYCSLIERPDGGAGSWLPEIAEILPRLDAALWSLDGRSVPVSLGSHNDLDARFDLYTRLLELLGELDGYWLEFDRIGGGQIMTGSLADDLTDIYCELKQGLARLSAEPQMATSGWLTGYVSHWGQHLVDAERHLTTLSAQGRLG